MSVVSIPGLSRFGARFGARLREDLFPVLGNLHTGYTPSEYQYSRVECYPLDCTVNVWEYHPIRPQSGWLID